MLWSEDKMISLVNVNKMEDINLDDLQCQIVIHPTSIALCAMLQLQISRDFIYPG
jgi:hypothetical protein